jgi:hypothetical protein
VTADFRGSVFTRSSRHQNGVDGIGSDEIGEEWDGIHGRLFWS